MSDERGLEIMASQSEVEERNSSSRDGTYLTAYRGLKVKRNQVKEYGHKGGQACKGVDLPMMNVQLSRTRKPSQNREGRVVTYPYCPSVWAAPPDDVPLVGKSSEEFPTGK